MTLFRDGRPVLETVGGIGSPATPTPTGSFYVNQRLIPTDTSGPFGPGAIGISAFSNVLTGWAQGGPIAIHGTNQPWSIGKPSRTAACASATTSSAGSFGRRLPGRRS